MATIKAITDLEQSQKLAEFLPIESADMWYSYYGNSRCSPTIVYQGQQWFLCQIRNSLHDDIPCWSLAALLNVLPFPQLSKDKLRIGVVWMVSVYPYPDNKCRYDSCWHDNPIDACYEMIVTLHKQNLL